MDNEQIEKLADEIKSNFDAQIKSAKENAVTKSDYDAFKTEVETKLEGVAVGDEVKAQIEAKFDELKEIVVEQGKKISAVKNQNEKDIAIKNGAISKSERIRKMVSAFVSSDLYKEHSKNDFRGQSAKLSEADVDKVVDITNDYTGGTVAITQRSGNVIDVPNREMNVRDMLSVTSTDQPNIVGQEVYDWADELTGSTDFIGENDTAPEGSFKIKENTWGIKRIAAFYDLSKRVLKSNGTQWVQNHLSNVLPKKLKFAEDAKLLYGDGSGDNPVGLAINAQSVTFGGNTYVATSFSSIATWNSGTQTLITFAAKHDLRNGDNLTLANTTGTTYDGTYSSIIVVSATQVIIDKAYAADAGVANWTGSSTNPFADSVDNAQEYDVLLATMGNVIYQNRKINGFILNPVDVAKIEMLKGTDAHYVGIARDASGILRVNGLPVLETTAVAAGKFFAGIFDADVVELAEFTQLNLFATDDVSYAKANKVAIVIEEEIIFPIFEPLAIFYGDFATAKAALETP